MFDFGCIAPVLALGDVFAVEGVAFTEAEARADMGKVKRDHLAAILASPGVAARWVDHFGQRRRAPNTRRIPGHKFGNGLTCANTNSTTAELNPADMQDAILPCPRIPFPTMAHKLA
jgi:hypothetical protein